MSRSKKSKLHHTIADCLSDLGVTPDHFACCDDNSLEEEFHVVKKIYFRKMLTDHPDKGGSAEAARRNITAWETLRELKAKNKLKSLTQHVSDVNVDDAYQAAEEAFDHHGGMEGGIPCYDHFYEAASVDVPGYKVELAKSDRSQCVACKKGTGFSLKKKADMAAAAVRDEAAAEPKKKTKAKAAAKGGVKKGKKKRAVDDEEKEEADGDESKEAAAADAAAGEDDFKPPARKRGRKAKSATESTVVAEEEEVPTVASAAEVPAVVASAVEVTVVASTGAAAKEEKKAASAADNETASNKPATTTRITRSRAAKTEAIVAISSSSSNNNNKKSKAKTAPPAAKAAAAGLSSSSKTTALAKVTSSKEFVVPPANINFVAKGSIRVGSIDAMSGSYGRWHHLPCWRVPFRVWAGLSNPEDADITLFELLRLDEVLLTGLTCLAKEDQMTFCAHVMDKSNWAKKTKSSKPPPDFSNVAAAVPVPSAASASAAAAGTTTLNATAKESSTAVVDASNQPPRKQAFVIPRPGFDGAIAGCLEGQKFVLTGTFPEVGGGTSLNLGKDKVKAMIESFGGKVTGSLSGKTNFLIVGKDPGFVKVTDATKRGLPRVDLMALQNRMLGRIESLEAAKPAVIKAYSAGYNAYLTNG